MSRVLSCLAVLALAVTVHAQERSRRAPQLPPGVWACMEIADFRSRSLRVNRRAGMGVSQISASSPT